MFIALANQRFERHLKQHPKTQVTAIKSQFCRKPDIMYRHEALWIDSS